jgi:hypothetical protein
MKGGAQVALAVGVGYLLGRRRKMRMATMIAAGAAAGGIGGLGPALLKRGAKFLSSTDIAGTFGPQVNEIVSTIRGDLLDAGKAAATTAVSSRMDSLSDSLHERAEAFRNPEAAVAGAGEAAGRASGKAGEAAGRATGKASEAAGRVGGSVGGLRRRRPAEDEEYAERDDDERRNGRSRRPRRAERSAADEPGPRSDEAEEPVDEYEDEEPYDDELDEPEAVDDLDEDEAEEPAPRRSRSSRSPVSRTRR